MLITNKLIKGTKLYEEEENRVKRDTTKEAGQKKNHYINKLINNVFILFATGSVL